MKLTHRTIENVHILEFSGNLMHHDVAHVTQQLHQIVPLHSTSWLIDLTELQQIDIHGLSVLLIMSKLARSTGGEVVLLNPNEIIQELLMLTDLHRLFAIYADKTAALADLTQHPLSLK